MSEDPGPCALCGRALALTRHHLIPRALHTRRRIRARFSREDLERTVLVCRECHDAVHALVSERDLAENVNTLEALRAHAGIARHAAWAAARPAGAKAPVMRRSKRTR